MPNCPSCGDRLTGIGPHVRSLACPSCGHWVFVSNGAWSDGGRFGSVLEAPPLLGVGRELAIGGRALVVAGRVRLGDEDGHWDEWWLEDVAVGGVDGYAAGGAQGGAGLWLEEDGGRYLRHEALEHPLPLEALRTLGVGGRFDAGGTRWFVTEAFVARVLGAEGALPVAFDAHESVRCLDAVGDGREISVELWADEAGASIAIPFDAAALVPT